MVRSCANSAGSEPVFIPCGAGEGEGHVLWVVYNGDGNTNELLIINAQKFEDEPAAIIKLGARIPFRFHGNSVRA